MAPERMVTVAIDLPLRVWLRLRQEVRQRAYAKGELEPETISPIVREIVEDAIERLDEEQGGTATAASTGSASS
jgi:phage tail tape-measure protein